MDLLIKWFIKLLFKFYKLFPAFLKIIISGKLNS